MSQDPCEIAETHDWAFMASLTHESQVKIFGWCSCEDNEGNPNPYEDCLTSDFWQLGEN